MHRKMQLKASLGFFIVDFTTSIDFISSDFISSDFTSWSSLLLVSHRQIFRPWKFMHAALNNWAANPSTKLYHQLRKCQVCKVCWESSYANQHLCCPKFCSSILSTHHKSCPPKLTTKCLIAPMNCTHCTLNYRANFVRHQHSRFSGCKCNVKA